MDLGTMKAFSRLMTTARSRLSLTHQHLQPFRPLSTIGNVNQGTKFTPDFKNYAVQNGSVISYFHDVPLGLDVATGTANFVVEIPRWSNAKFEISTSQPGNPIVQDTKKGKVRFVRNLFPYHGYIHNYGAFPQTWEDPTSKTEGLDVFGDNDPVDVCEIGSQVHTTGAVRRVKILGSLALIDDGELDWKVIVVDTEDPLGAQVDDIDDVRTACPGLLESTHQWFRDYKKPDGKPENVFAFDGHYRNRAQTLATIQECHESWAKLLRGETKGDKLPLTQNTSQPWLTGHVKSFDSAALLSNPSQPDAPLPAEVHKSYFF